MLIEREIVIEPTVNDDVIKMTGIRLCKICDDLSIPDLESDRNS